MRTLAVVFVALVFCGAALAAETPGASAGAHAEPRKRESGTGGLAPLFLAGPLKGSGHENNRAAVWARQEFF